MIEITLKSFQANQDAAKKWIIIAKEELARHRHGFFCFSWSRCRKWEAFIAGKENNIKEYGEAVKEMNEEKYDKAIEILGRMANEIQESSWWAAMRAGLTPEINYVFDTPDVVVARMIEARDYLKNLQLKPRCF